MIRSNLLALGVLLALVPAAADAKTICTVVADVANGKLLLEEGDCRSRVTPASTFKIPLAVMGFDSGFLTAAHAPVLPFRKGYPDWMGENLTQPTDPVRSRGWGWFVGWATQKNKTYVFARLAQDAEKTPGVSRHQGALLFPEGISGVGGSDGTLMSDRARR